MMMMTVRWTCASCDWSTPSREGCVVFPFPCCPLCGSRKVVMSKARLYDHVDPTVPLKSAAAYLAAAARSRMSRKR